MSVKNAFKQKVIMSGHDSNFHIIQSLAVNLLIVVVKAVAAFLTGSASLLAETIHSFADCCNQVLLLVGVKQSRKAPDAKHPLGYGRALYFWSFMVALFLFLGGGVFSIYEGIHKVLTPEKVELVGVGAIVLAIALLLEGYATISNVKEINKRRGSVPFFRYLKETKDSDLVVIFGENLADTLGAMIALPALLMSWETEQSWWDGAGSFGVGLVLVAISFFLATEVRSLLLGESASPHIESAVRTVAARHPAITKILHMLAIQQGPGQVLLLLKLGFRPELSIGDVSDRINAFEDDLRKECSEVRWCFIEPDRPRTT